MTNSSDKLLKALQGNARSAPTTQPLTEAGRITAAYNDFRAQSATRAGQPASPGRNKPSATAVRDAQKHAASAAGHAKQERFTAAIAAYKSAIRLDPTVAATHYNLGVTLTRVKNLTEAADAFYHAVRIDPSLANGWLNLAIALDHLGRTTEALHPFQMVAKLRPDLHAMSARLGQLHEARGEIAEAVAASEAAADAAPPVDALVHRAQAARIAGALTEASALLRQAVALNPLASTAHIRLGHILIQEGQTAEGIKSLQEGLRLEPNQTPAWHALSTQMKFTPDDQPLIEQMRAILAKPDLSPGLALFLHFALGKAHDDLGAYAAAIGSFDAGNRIRARAARMDRAALTIHVEQTIAQTPSDYLTWRPDLANPDQTPILIVGMPRSGTTLVEQILSSHPKVAAGGELRFWRHEGRTPLGAFDRSAKPDAARALADQYLATLRAISPDAERVTDKMPFNFSRLGLIRQIFPNAVIIHCRRNPVDICLSIYTTLFEAAHSFAADRGDLVAYYRRYERLMAHWRQVLPADRFLDVQYEDLVAAPEPITRRLIAACGLEWDDACLAPHLNTRRIATASLWQARQPIYRTSVARWRRYEPWLGELRSLLRPDGDQAA